MRYQLLLWDFDGTLADTLDLSVRLFNELAGKYGFRPIDDARSARDLTTLAFLKKHRVSPRAIPALHREFVALARAQMAGVRLFSGLVDTLRAARQKGCRCGVLSSNGQDNITACLRANGVADVFEFVVGYVRLLGKARGIRRVLKAQRVKADQLLYVGDEVRDIGAARKAGVDSAAVTWGFHDRHILAGCSPTYLIAHPANLLAVLEQDGQSNPR